MKGVRGHDSRGHPWENLAVCASVQGCSRPGLFPSLGFSLLVIVIAGELGIIAHCHEEARSHLYHLCHAGGGVSGSLWPQQIQTLCSTYSVRGVRAGRLLASLKRSDWLFLDG